MAHLFNRFSLQSAKWNSTVVGVLFLGWFCVLICVISSIRAQPFDRQQRWFWIGMVILLPVFGVLAYLPFAFQKEDLPHMFLRKSNKPKRSRSSASSPDL